MLLLGRMTKMTKLFYLCTIFFICSPHCHHATACSTVICHSKYLCGYMIYFAEIDLHSLRFIKVYNYILFSDNDGGRARWIQLRCDCTLPILCRCLWTARLESQQQIIIAQSKMIGLTDLGRLFSWSCSSKRATALVATA